MAFLTSALLGFASLAAAQGVARYCLPQNQKVCYAFNVPASAASSGTGDLFLQITAPAAMEWVSMGQSPTGQMAGANYFVVYGNAAADNVTLSPRLSGGHSMPTYNAAAKVTLLDGSGISNGTMTANIKCTNCDTWTGGTMKLNSASSTWIWAYLDGSSTASDSTSALIAQHDAYGSFSLDLRTAAGGASPNPFAAAAASSPPSNSSSAGITTLSVSTSSAPPTAGVATAHGAFAGLAFGVLYPLGAVLKRLGGALRLHAGIQGAALALSVLAAGSGLYVAHAYGLLASAHALLGIALSLALLALPWLGYRQHQRGKRSHRREPPGFAHVYLGRAVVVLGLLNAGLGLQLTNRDGPLGAAEIAGAVLVGLVGGAWLGVTLVTAFLRRRAARTGGRGGHEPLSDFEGELGGFGGKMGGRRGGGGASSEGSLLGAEVHGHGRDRRSIEMDLRGAR